MNENRDKIIVRTSFVGIATNVVLSVLKMIIGLLTNSIAITMDAVNNIADAASSIITIVGTKLAGKEADKKHPFGYGRVEYFTALVIAIIVLYAGVTSLQESVKSIFNPETPNYTTVSLIVVAIGVVAKIILGRYFVKVGKQVDSASLTGSGEEATLDSVISFATLVAAGIYLLTNFSIESYLAAIISIVIIKSGLEMLRDTISRLLGEGVDISLSQEIKETVRSFPEVEGAYDLVLNDYGPDAFQGSVHVEVQDTVSASELDNLIRSIQVEVYKKHRVILTAVGIYSINTKDEKVIAERNKVSKIALDHEYVKQVHGFFIDQVNKTIRFDVVISFDAPSRKEVYLKVLEDLGKEYPGYMFNVAMDVDYSEL